LEDTIMISPQDLLLWGAVGFVLFGAKRMPEVARSLGSSVVEFKKAMRETSEAIGSSPDEVQPPHAGQPRAPLAADAAQLPPDSANAAASEAQQLTVQATILHKQAVQLKANPLTQEAGNALEEQAAALFARAEAANRALDGAEKAAKA
jgi:sec-independent protein translocase protein TatA